MKKLRNPIQLQSYLDGEFAWRLKEIADTKSVVKQTEQLRQRTAIRAGVPLLYAHWEGFVKRASLAYLNFVNCQDLQYNQLTSCFVVFGVKRVLGDLMTSKQSRTNISAIEFLLNNLNDTADLKFSHAVDTESNLGSRTFENIALSLGLDPSRYEPRYHWIDESLLKRRNEIAHGAYLDLEARDFSSLADDVLLLMRWYKDDIENAATLRHYRRVVA